MRRCPTISQAAIEQYGIEPAVRSALLVLLDERKASVAVSMGSRAVEGGAAPPRVVAEKPVSAAEGELDSDDVSDDGLYELD